MSYQVILSVDPSENRYKKSREGSRLNRYVPRSASAIPVFIDKRGNAISLNSLSATTIAVMLLCHFS